MVDLSQDKPLKPHLDDSPAGDEPPVTPTPPVPPPPPKKEPPSPKIEEKEKIVTPQQEEIKKELSELGISPKGGSKKTKILLATLGVLLLIATLPAAIYLVRQRQEIKVEAAVEGTGQHCTAAKCTISVGPDYLSFKAKGHGTRNTSTPTVSLNIPDGSTVYKAYAIWGGERSRGTAKDNNFRLKVNNGTEQQVAASVDYNTYIPEYDTEPDVFLADITSLLPENTTQFTFTVTRGLMQGGYNADDAAGAGYGIAYIIIYKNSTNPYSKIVIRIWGEFVLRNVSANMAFNIGERKPGSNKLRMAFFFGEGEGSMVGGTRPNYLFYNEDNNKRLNPTDNTDFPAWGSDPGHWWDTRITGDDLPAISALANTATFHTKSPSRSQDPENRLGDSMVWLGGIAEYEMEAPTYECWDECSQQSDCDPAGLTCSIPPGDTVQRCLDSDCPSQQDCTCLPTVCEDLTANPSVETLKQGDAVQFTCQGSSGIDTPIDHVEFRLFIDETEQDLGDLASASVTEAEGEYKGSITYTLPETAGDYRVECRVCTSTDCTQWGAAK